MKHLLFWLALLLLSCQSHSQSVPEEVPYGRDPVTPSLAVLQALPLVMIDSMTTEQHMDEDHRGVFRYFLDGVPYNGWGVQEFPDNEHRIRFLLFDDGYHIWQIGYWDNGVLDHDFHQKDTRNLGSQRMWNRDGSPYINYFYSSPGKMDGLQQRWHTNGQLARKGMWKDGDMVFEVLYDEAGNVVEERGK